MRITGTIEYEVTRPNGPDDVDREIESVPFKADSLDDAIAEMSRLQRYVEKRQNEVPLYAGDND